MSTVVGGLHELIATHAETSAEVAIGIETDRGLWVQSLIVAGYRVYGVNPRAELAALEMPDGQLTSAEIAHLLDELGGMEGVLAEAEPPEKAALYASLGLRLPTSPISRRFSPLLTWAVWLVVSEGDSPSTYTRDPHVAPLNL